MLLDEPKESFLRKETMFDYQLGNQPLDVVQDYIPMGATTTLFGQPGLGKTFAAMSLVMSVVTSKPWCGASVDVTGNAGMLSFECSQEEVHRRIQGYMSYFGLTREMITHDPIIRHNKGLSLKLPKHKDTLKAFIEKEELRLLVIDTLAKVMEFKEDSTSDMATFATCLSNIAAETTCAIVVVHHEAKGSYGKKKGTSRSSNALEGDVRSEMRIHNFGGLTLSHTKVNNSTQRNDVHFNLVDQYLGDDRYGRPMNTKVFVPQITPEEQAEDFNSNLNTFTLDEYRNSRNIADSTARKELKNLQDNKYIIKPSYHSKMYESTYELNQIIRDKLYSRLVTDNEQIDLTG